MPHLGFFLLFEQQHNLTLVCVKSSLVDTMSNELSVKITIAFQKEKELVKLILDKCLDEHHGSLHVEVVLDGKLHGPSNSRTKIEMDLSFFFCKTLFLPVQKVLFLSQLLLSLLFNNMCEEQHFLLALYSRRYLVFHSIMQNSGFTTIKFQSVLQVVLIWQGPTHLFT